jgi:hypothetical protein
MTIHQGMQGYLWHWRTGPGWCRDGAEIRKLKNAGMKTLKVQLQDDGDIPRDQVDEWRIDGGVQVWGMYWPQGQPLNAGGTWDPSEAATWLRSERVRLALKGLDCNHEDPVRRLDLDTGGEWSDIFASRLRALCPSLPLHLDSYFGAAAGGINLGAYKVRGFRFCWQSFWGSEGIWDDPPTRMVQWGEGAQPRIPKSVIKPIFRVAKNNQGQLPDFERVVFPNWRLSGCLGGAYYYIDGADFDWLLWLYKEAIRRGLALLS